MEQIKGLIYGLLITGFIIAITGFAMMEFSSNYNVNYDNATILKYNAYTQEMNESLDASRTSIGNSNTTNNNVLAIYDMVGDILNNGIKTAKMMWFSYGTATDMGSQALEDSNIDKTGILKTTLMSLLLVMFLFAFIYILTGRK